MGFKGRKTKEKSEREKEERKKRIKKNEVRMATYRSSPGGNGWLESPMVGSTDSAGDSDLQKRRDIYRGFAGSLKEGEG
jgi:hypothetical protein